MSLPLVVQIRGQKIEPIFHDSRNDIKHTTVKNYFESIADCPTYVFLALQNNMSQILLDKTLCNVSYTFLNL